MDERILAVFKEALLLNEEELGGLADDSSIFSVAKWDSFAHLRLLAALEKKFNISIGDSEAVELIDIREIKNNLKRKGVNL